MTRASRVALLLLSGSAGACGIHSLQAVDLPPLACAAPAPTPLVDQITFGDAGSEALHAFSGAGTILGTGPFGETSRRIDVGAPLSFQVAVSGGAQNYATVKLWGSDTDTALIFLYAGGARLGGYGQDLPELDFNPGEEAFPERFVYVTYPLPRNATDSNTSLSLGIDAIGSYSMFRPAGQEEAPLTKPTRPIYGLYVHTDPFFVPPDAETQGTPPALSIRPPPAGYPDFATVHQQADASVALILASQVYGDTWTTAVAAGRVSAAVLGLFGNVSPSSYSTEAAWKNWAASSATGSNAVILRSLSVLGLIYGSTWSRYYASAEILARVTSALDSLALMEGANGAFTSTTWVGAPARAAAAGSSTEGSGTRGMGRSFVLLADALASAGTLDALVDDDGDPTTPSVPRRQAWADMFARHRDFLASPPGRSQNTMYDQSQVEALWWANEAVRLLVPARALPRDVMVGYVAGAVGVGAGPIGAPWVSPRGLALEPSGTLDGGFDGRWGVITIRTMCVLAQQTADPSVRARCLDAVHAIAPFLYPSGDAGLTTMRSESAISTEINRSPGFVAYGGNSYAAAALADPVAVRAIQLSLAHHMPLAPPSTVDSLFPENLSNFLEDLPAIEAVAAMPPESSPFRFPMEEGQPDVTWADVGAGSVAVRNCGDLLYATLNWRRGFTDGVADLQHARVNDIVRVHLTRASYDRVATATMQSPFGFGQLYVASFGPYTVALNPSPADTHDLGGLAGAVPALELVEGRRVPSAASVVVPPGQARILYAGVPR